MHLKRITIVGFKSFADRVTLNFDRGITGIVGPNGSGKSNVIDAVRWVMGEQNAKNLRGEKATDIIFAGSDRRKGLAMAEVTLTFDNTDDTTGFCPPEYRHEAEISLTRRLYADNQREYLINKKACRLKDIVGFFASTGLGGRSYSMIQQGQVDRILNAKPEDVREILEEAAGTLLYKHRKGEAQKKLESTQMNLSRVTDILAEVERQRGSLQDQVEKAQKWQEFTTELRDEELLLLAHNFAHFNEKLLELEGQVASDQIKEVEAMTSVSSFEARHTELQQILDEADPGLAALNEQITVLREHIARSEATIMSASAKVETGEKRLITIASELGEDGENLKMLESQVDGANAELAAADTDAIRLREAIEQFNDDVEQASEAAMVYKSKLDEFDDEIKNLSRMIDSNKYRVEALSRDKERALRNKSEQNERLQSMLADISSALETVAKAQEKVGAQQAGLDIEIRDKHSREAAVAQRYGQMKDANNRRDLCREKYHETRARLTSLEELVAGATDVSATLQDLRTKAPQTNDVVKGLLADFLAFNDRATELPKTLSGAFERWTERVVVESVDALNELVRTAQKHSATAMPVTVLSLAKPIDKEAAGTWAENHGAEPLASFLKIDTKLNGIENLTDRLYVLQTLAISKDVLAEIPDGLIVFTAQGVSFTSEDEFIVGAKGSSGLLSRKTEQENLAKQLKKYEHELAACQAEIDDLEMKINQDRQIVAEIDTKLQAQNKDVLAVMSELQSAQQVADHKQDLVTAAQKTVDELTTQEEAFVKEVTELDLTRESLQVEMKTIENDMTALREEAETLEERREEVTRQYQQKRLDLAKSESRAQALRDGYVHTKAQLDLLQNKLSRRYEEQHVLTAEIEQAKSNFAEAQKGIETFLMQREEFEEQLAEKREQNAGVHEELRVIESRLKDYRDAQTKIQKSISDKSVALERARMAHQGVTSQAMEKYALDISTHSFVFDENFNIEKSARLVSGLRTKIENIGPVNMMAMKEYTELTERENFISGQKDEILASMDLLITAIQEIESTSEEKFMATFKTINENFSQLFPILFPGGEGRLELSNPEDPLNGGVEIMVRLPGKKMQRMNLFSGGEKALTAISLIFALLKTKPTPFCFLDEVDAPLDEANVGRYNRVLDALSEQFQFVIITHNRRTMEVLDTLYGITMQEPGVSSVVGVDMKKDLPPHLRKAFKEGGIGGTEKRQGAVAAKGAEAIEASSPEAELQPEIASDPLPEAASENS